MIELNLTYEESKKIFELGYDFSKICDFAWVTMNTNETPVLVCQNSEIQYLLFAQKIYDFQTALIQKQPIEIIPVIPKAASEACLPEFTTNKAWFSLVKDSYPETRTHYWIFETPKTIPQSDTWDRSPRLLMRYVKKQMLYENLHSAYFKSAYEAFIWCHENYPEELKKKFEEVMK